MQKLEETKQCYSQVSKLFFYQIEKYIVQKYFKIKKRKHCLGNNKRISKNNTQEETKYVIKYRGKNAEKRT